MDRMDLRYRWDRLREKQDVLKKSGRAEITIKQSTPGAGLTVVVPGNIEFIKYAESIGGRWRYRSGVWKFGLKSKDLVISASLRIFGMENVVVKYTKRKAIA